MATGVIFDIKRYAINDGPGIRTTIFFKGCPLSCAWCHNPEGMSPKVEKMYSQVKCIGCQECVQACTRNACTLTSEGIVTDKKLCVACGECADACPTTATEMSGQTETTDSIMKILEKETVFFDQSGGGVTFSGGEPLRQAKFLLELLQACGERGIHRTVDTSGFVRLETLLEVARHTDHFLFDLKVMDPEKHKQLTGVSNKLILQNLKLLAETGASINLRLPLVEGVNDDDANIDEVTAFAKSLPGESKKVNLLPYHGVAVHKYEKLGKSYHSNGMAAPSEKRQTQIVERLKAAGVDAVLNG